MYTAKAHIRSCQQQMACSKMQMLKMQMQNVNTKHMEKDKRHQITAAQKATRTENHSNQQHLRTAVDHSHCGKGGKKNAHINTTTLAKKPIEY